LPECLDDCVKESNPVRVFDAFVDALDLAQLGFDGVDAVIAALRIAQEEAEKGRGAVWKTRAANRWVDQLPGAWMGRWLHLRLRAGLFEEGEVDRDEFIGHVRATIAYLEANRESGLPHEAVPVPKLGCGAIRCLAFDVRSWR
jgi:hypothetical protein